MTPSFNQGRWLEKTIRSVLLQGYPNLEYILVDGGSRDESVDLIKKYEPWIQYWVSEPDDGQCDAINKGFSKATGQILGWVNSDDWLASGALSSVAGAWMKRKPSTGAVVGDGKIVDSTGALWYQPPMHEITADSIYRWLEDSNFMQPSCFFSHAAWNECGPLDEEIHISLDVDLWLRIAARFDFERIDSMLSYSLKHENAKTTEFEQKMYVDLAFVYLKHGNAEAARNVLELLAERSHETAKDLAYLQSRFANRLDSKFQRLWKKLTGAPGQASGQDQ